MGKWAKIRWMLRGIAGAVGGVVTYVVAGPFAPLVKIAVAVIGSAVAGGAGGLSKDLPRDPWPKEKRRAKLEEYDDEIDTPIPPFKKK